MKIWSQTSVLSLSLLVASPQMCSSLSQLQKIGERTLCGIEHLQNVPSPDL